MGNIFKDTAIYSLQDQKHKTKKDIFTEMYIKSKSQKVNSTNYGKGLVRHRHSH